MRRTHHSLIPPLLFFALRLFTFHPSPFLVISFYCLHTHTHALPSSLRLLPIFSFVFVSPPFPLPAPSPCCRLIPFPSFPPLRRIPSLDNRSPTVVALHLYARSPVSEVRRQHTHIAFLWSFFILFNPDDDRTAASYVQDFLFLFLFFFLLLLFLEGTVQALSLTLKSISSRGSLASEVGSALPTLPSGPLLERPPLPPPFPFFLCVPSFFSSACVQPVIDLSRHVQLLISSSLAILTARTPTPRLVHLR